MSQNFESEFDKLKNPPRNIQKQQITYDELLQKIEEVDSKPNFWPRLQYPLILIATCIVLLITVFTLSPNDSRKPLQSASMGLKGIANQHIKSIYMTALREHAENGDEFYARASKAYVNIQKITDTNDIATLANYLKNSEKVVEEPDYLYRLTDLIVVTKEEHIKLKLFKTNEDWLYVQNWDSKEMYRIDDSLELFEGQLTKIDEQNHEWRNLIVGSVIMAILQYVVKFALSKLFNIRFPKMKRERTWKQKTLNSIIFFLGFLLVNFSLTWKFKFGNYYYFGILFLVLFSIDMAMDWKKLKENSLVLIEILTIISFLFLIIILVIIK